MRPQNVPDRMLLIAFTQLRLKMCFFATSQDMVFFSFLPENKIPGLLDSPMKF